ncbi:hypothetical protein E6R62_05925 [Streptomyces sp. A1136]|nr:hypothetical protein E6R62_05925 [Streptomyces sp. A1136]
MVETLEHALGDHSAEGEAAGAPIGAAYRLDPAPGDRPSLPESRASVAAAPRTLPQAGTVVKLWMVVDRYTSPGRSRTDG